MNASQLRNVCGRGLAFAFVFTSGFVGEAAAQGHELFKLLPSDGTGSDNFGVSVAMGPDVVAVGSYHNNKGASQAGRVYVYRFDGVAWGGEKRIDNPSAQSGDEFGRSVGISGDALVIGAPGDDSLKSNAGAAYVYRFDGTDWNCEAKLVAPDGVADDSFGFAVAIDGSYLVVGSGDHDHAGVGSSGGAYVFRYEPMLPGWIFDEELLDTTFPAVTRFGDSVSVRGTAIAVGAPRDSAMGPPESGAITVFRHSSSWIPDPVIRSLTPVDGDQLGTSVSLGDGALAAGAPFADLSPVLVDAGEVHVFRFASGAWTEEAERSALIPQSGALFGRSVALDGSALVVGSDRKDEAGGTAQGAVYLLLRSATTWNEDSMLVASDGIGSDLLGVSVALSGSRAVAGAVQQDTKAADCGAAYIFGVADLELDVVPPIVNEGQSVTLSAFYGLAGSPVILTVVAVNSIPSFIPLAFSTFATDLEFSLTASVPFGVAPVDIDFVAFAFGAGGGVVAAGPTHLQVQ